MKLKGYNIYNNNNNNNNNIEYTSTGDDETERFITFIIII